MTTFLNMKIIYTNHLEIESTGCSVLKLHYSSVRRFSFAMNVDWIKFSRCFHHEHEAQIGVGSATVIVSWWWSMRCLQRFFFLTIEIFDYLAKACSLKPKQRAAQRFDRKFDGSRTTSDRTMECSKLLYWWDADKASCCNRIKLSFLGRGNHQPHHNQCCTGLVPSDRQLQRYNKHRVVVHAGHAATFLVPRPWKVLHSALVASWNRRHQHRHAALFHRFSFGHPSAWYHPHHRRNLRIYYDCWLRLFGISQVHRMEERWTRPRDNESLDHDNNDAIVSLSCLNTFNLREHKT